MATDTMRRTPASPRQAPGRGPDRGGPERAPGRAPRHARPAPRPPPDPRPAPDPRRGRRAQVTLPAPRMPVHPAARQGCSAARASAGDGAAATSRSPACRRTPGPGPPGADPHRPGSRAGNRAWSGRPTVRHPAKPPPGLHRPGTGKVAAARQGPRPRSTFRVRSVTSQDPTRRPPAAGTTGSPLGVLGQGGRAVRGGGPPEPPGHGEAPAPRLSPQPARAAPGPGNGRPDPRSVRPAAARPRWPPPGTRAGRAGRSPCSRSSSCCRRRPGPAAGHGARQLAASWRGVEQNRPVPLPALARRPRRRRPGAAGDSRRPRCMVGVSARRSRRPSCRWPAAASADGGIAGRGCRTSSVGLATFWIDDIFEGLYGIVLLGFSRIIGWIDRYLVDGVLNVLSAWTLQAGDGLRGIQTGKPQDYVYGVGARRTGADRCWMRLVVADERPAAAFDHHVVAVRERHSSSCSPRGIVRCSCG